MTTVEVSCKSALSATSLPGLDYSLNPYRGCAHNCAYCYAPCILRMARSEWGTRIEAKMNIAVILAKEVAKKKPGIVGLSTVTDPYQPIEQEYTLSQQCLQVFLDTEFPVHIQTKSILVKRDVDLLSRLCNAQVMMTITTLHDEERRLLEPTAASIHDRLTALKTLTDAGIQTTVFLGPLYPTTTPEDLTRLLDALRVLDVNEVWVDKLNNKPGIGEEIDSRLLTLPLVRAAFEEALRSGSSYFPALRQHLREAAHDRGIHIIDAF